MPFKLTKTSSDIFPWGKSVQFNGTNQWLTVATDTTGVGTARNELAAAGYSLT